MWLIGYMLTLCRMRRRLRQHDRRTHYVTAGVSAHRHVEIRFAWPEPPLARVRFTGLSRHVFSHAAHTG